MKTKQENTDYAFLCYMIEELPIENLEARHFWEGVFKTEIIDALGITTTLPDKVFEPGSNIPFWQALS